MLSTNLCECGCGQYTNLSNRTCRKDGVVKGQPLRFIHPHKPHTDPIPRFWSRVDKSGGPDACWPWLRGTNGHGYGVFHPKKGVRVYAHRYAYTLCIGPIEPGLVLDHIKCDNPPCCNPTHIVQTTARANTLRGNSPAAISARRKTCPHGHTYTKDNTIIEKAGNRRCSICKREYEVRYKQNNREYFKQKQREYVLRKKAKESA